MLETNAHQQIKSGISTGSRTILSQLGVESTSPTQFPSHPLSFQSPTQKTNTAIPNNSMIRTDMDFFVRVVPVFSDSSKQERFPASV